MLYLFVQLHEDRNADSIVAGFQNASERPVVFHVAAVANNSPQSILEAIAIVGTPANLDIAAPIATANFKILKRIGACFATRDAAARAAFRRSGDSNAEPLFTRERPCFIARTLKNSLSTAS